MGLSRDGFDLETLARMGITEDNSARKDLRIGHDLANEMKIGGGRWLTTEEKANIPAAIRGYGSLPSEVKDGMYTGIELYHLAVEIGTNGVPRYHDARTETLEILLKSVDGPGFRQGKPGNDLLMAYWKNNNELGEDDYSTPRPLQFMNGMVKDAEAEIGLLVKDAKEAVRSDPKLALASALRAAYLSKTVAYLKPKLENFNSYARDAQPALAVA